MLNLTTLNAEQREAVTSTEGPLLIIAGAGSGKTRVITHRIAYLIEEKGVEPGQILAVTFTNKAAGEMKQRVEDLTGLSARSLWVSTFHSAAVRLLRLDGPAIHVPRTFAIYDDGDTMSLLRRIMKELGLDPRKDDPDLHASHISRAKDEILGPDEWLEKSRGPRAMAELTHAIYTRYQAALDQANALDFGDLLVKAVRLLEQPAMREKYQEKFRYQMVDEYQDTNTVQCRFIQLLAEKRRNLCVVGDDDQSIYGWRGADRRNILSFERVYPDAKVVVLNRNYRSTQPILDAASNLIGHNVRIREKRLVTDRAKGAAPEVVGVSTEYAEAERIAADILAHSRQGLKLRDHAVFFRVHAQSRVIEETFSASGLPYQLLSGVSFYQRAEIKDVMAYLKLAANPADDVSLRRIVNVPARGIGDTTVAKIAEAAAGRTLLETMRTAGAIEGIAKGTVQKVEGFVRMMDALSAAAASLPVGELVRETLSRSLYRTKFDEHDPEDEERLENVAEFLSVADEFQSSAEQPTLEAFLERVSLATDVDTYDEDSDTVVCSTLHSAKGLEFRHVYIVGCEETLFPHSKAYGDAGPDAMEEERRLAYVGFTRAMESLKLYVARERRIYGRIVANIPSRFIREAGLELPASFRTVPLISAAAHARPYSFSPRAASTSAAARPAPAPAWKPASVPPPASGKTGAFSEGDMVEHRKFGRGVVLYVSDSGSDEEVVQVRFAGGVKNLMSKFANLARVK